MTRGKWTLLITFSIFLATGLLFMGGTGAWGDDSSYKLSSKVEKAYSNLSSNDDVKRGLKFIMEDDEQTLQDQIDLTEIPSPPFMEQERAENYQQRLHELGLEDVHIDHEGNVIGTRSGNGSGPRLFVTAHLDTVFPEGTDTTVTEKDGILYAPGIIDDSRGLAAMLSIIRAFNETNLKNIGDIVFVGTVGEEGLGDLRGVKALFNEHDDIDGFISIDGVTPGGITYKATGSHRYEFTYKGPGGHSFGAFGTPSPIHAMGRAIAEISDVETPSDPKTTFTVGTIEGGTSVNAIADRASMLVDMRSNSNEELVKLDNQIQEIIKWAADAENQRWDKSDVITSHVKLVGDRPAGSQPDNAINVQAAWASAGAIDIQPNLNGPSSTDSNVAISLGVPALTLGGGGKGGGSHSLAEWFDPTDAYLGPQHVFMTILGLVGVENISEPLLDKSKSETRIKNISEMRDMITQFIEEGQFEDADNARLLDTHLIALQLYEKKENNKKMVKHLNGFKLLLKNHKEKELIRDKAYSELNNGTNELIRVWEK